MSRLDRIKVSTGHTIEQVMNAFQGIYNESGGRFIEDRQGPETRASRQRHKSRRDFFDKSFYFIFYFLFLNRIFFNDFFIVTVRKKNPRISVFHSTCNRRILGIF